MFNMFPGCISSAFAVVFILSCSVFGQGERQRGSAAERQIRKLDLAAAEAIRNKDEAAIDRYFARDSVTNNPRGGLTLGNSGVKKLFQTGVIDYLDFRREIETVRVLGETAVVMGNETVTTRSRDGHPAETYRRRYTNVWMRRSGRWQIIARHASVVCP